MSIHCVPEVLCILEEFSFALPTKGDVLRDVVYRVLDRTNGCHGDKVA